MSSHHAAGTTSSQAAYVRTYWLSTGLPNTSTTERFDRGRPARAAEGHPVDELGDPDEQQRGSDAGDVLVGAERHGEQRHQSAGEQSDRDRRGEAEEQRAGGVRRGEAEERTGVHRSLDAKVEDSGPLGVGLADGAVDERR